MNITVTCRHMEMSSALRDHATSRVEESLTEFPRVEDVHVILDVQRKINHVAEVVVKAKNHVHAEATETTSDMYASIDAAVDKVHRQLRKNRDKIQDHKNIVGLGEMEAGLS
ncbi:ribosome-associated translation inhibitor RaiA [Kiritimatiellota bacterium B12222]|nr:ribosome-associated translation inhibitor RaiA [Kiritimatiellota bacterium B12222]